jgi:hypothetical protein
LLDSGILRNVVKDVFVTPQDALEDETGDLFRLSLGKNCFHDCGYAEIIAPSVFALYDQSLKASERLVYGRRYYFWSFDYERSNFVFLGRHTRHAGKDDSRVEYSLAARPLLPNQSWEVIATNNDKHPGDVVQWGDNIGLTVAGDNPHPRRPDSTRRSLLSCLSNDDHPYSTGTTNSLYTRDKRNWCFVQDNMKLGPNELLMLLPSTPYISTHVVTESKKLIVHAIPEACDEGEYQLYSPASLRYGQAACDGLHIKLNFEHWIEKGVIYVRAPVLPFTLGLPILKTDYASDTPVVAASPAGCSVPLANLLQIKSARWGCFIYYMAVAADVTEGKALDMDRFLRRVTDHQDHTVTINDTKDFVYIHVRGNKVKLDVQDVPRPPVSISPSVNDFWYFLLSW